KQAVVGLGEIDHHVHALLFNAKSTDLGDAEGLNVAHAAHQRLTAPALNADVHALPHAHGLAAQQVNDDFERRGVTQLKQHLARLHGAFTDALHAQHAALDRRRNHDALASTIALTHR